MYCLTPTPTDGLSKILSAELVASTQGYFARLLRPQRTVSQSVPSGWLTILPAQVAAKTKRTSVSTNTRRLRVAVENPETSQPLVLTDGIGAIGGIVYSFQQRFSIGETITFATPGLGCGLSPVLSRSLRKPTKRCNSLVSHSVSHHAAAILRLVHPLFGRKYEPTSRPGSPRPRRPRAPVQGWLPPLLYR